MSNSGTATFCLADFIKLPIPALRAMTSFSSVTVSATGGKPFTPFVPLSMGDAGRVGGSESTDISIKIDALLRIAGSKANRVIVGLGGGWRTP